MQQQTNEEMTASLLATARDETKAAEERHAALRHVCQLRGDAYAHVPPEQLRFVAAAMSQAELEGCKFGPLSLRDAAEAVAAGFARTALSRHR